MPDRVLMDAGLIRRIAVSMEAMRACMALPCMECAETVVNGEGFCQACQSVYDRASDVLLDVRLLCVAAR